jgi:SAM-dependent MidA family methyltransferase
LLSKTVAERRSQNKLVTEIATILRQQMEREGVISFAQFMETALYCPKVGYYERLGGVIGRAGDFYTSVSVGPLFGRLLARQFAQWLNDQPVGAVQLVEAGAHDGQLAFDILERLESDQPALFARLEYWLLEPSEGRRRLQEQKLDRFGGHVRWAESWTGLPGDGMQGVIFCNELLDAFPVHRLAWDVASRRWVELGVGIAGTEFEWRRMETPARDWEGELRRAGFEFSSALLAVLPEGFVVDFCPSAGDWWRRAARALSIGKLVTFDYGFTAEQGLAPERIGGTLRAYSRHHASGDVLADPGEQDVTAHVNFTQLRIAGEETGLVNEEFVSQAQFLTRVAGREWQDTPPTPTEVRQFQSLTHPEHLGRVFRVLVQSRGVASPVS